MLIKSIRLAILLPFLLAATSVSAKSSLFNGIIEHDGVERPYYFELPEDYIMMDSIPLLVVLHAAGGDGKQAAEQWGFHDLTKKGVLVVYPDGISNQWNDGRGIAFSEDYDVESVDDIAYLRKLIRYISKRYPVDKERVFVTGASNGGMMSFRVGCEMADVVSGIAPIVAGMPETIVANCSPAKPIRVLLMNGTKDKLIPYDGGEVTANGQEFGEVLSTSDSAKFWVKQNKCEKGPDSYRLPDTNEDDSSSVSFKEYSNCKEDANVGIYTILGGGHTVPGMKGEPDDRLGNINRDIKAPVAIWKFFSSKD